jgi:3-hydroxybutyrate dehydrogenase
MLKTKVALITGSTSGIGLAIARTLAREGTKIMLHGLGDPAEVEQLRTDLASETGATVLSHDADLSSAAEASRLVTDTAARLGPVDILVNNAGIQFVSRVEDFPAERWTKIQEVNLGAAFHTIRASLPAMRQRNWGRIINVASAHGLVASPFKCAYVAAKHGLVGLTKTVALEVAETGITCNAICPGYVRTPLIEAQIEDQAKAHGLPREQVTREVILTAQPTRRFIEPDEVAQLVLFLCAESARSITGTAIPIDGGWTAR